MPLPKKSRTTRHRRGGRHHRRTKRGGGFFDFFGKATIADNNIVQLALPPANTPITCSICQNKFFQVRPSTIRLFY
jgi:hypothetical protein